MDGRIYHILAEVTLNPGFPWTISKLAGLVGLSAPHFQKLFRETIGVAAMAYIHDVRLKNARELIETTVLSLKEIQFKVGLRDASHFSSDFKRTFGASPREYRKQYCQRIQAEQAAGKK